MPENCSKPLIPFSDSAPNIPVTPTQVRAAYADDFALDDTQVGAGDWYCIRMTRRQ